MRFALPVAERVKLRALSLLLNSGPCSFLLSAASRAGVLKTDLPVKSMPRGFPGADRGAAPPPVSPGRLIWHISAA